jgi:hypothetical protein
MENFLCLQLMSKMSQLLGRDMTERLFLQRFCEMCTDPLFHVRKVIYLKPTFIMYWVKMKDLNACFNYLYMVFCKKKYIVIILFLLEFINN